LHTSEEALQDLILNLKNHKALLECLQRDLNDQGGTSVTLPLTRRTAYEALLAEEMAAAPACAMARRHPKEVKVRHPWTTLTGGLTTRITDAQALIDDAVAALAVIRPILDGSREQELVAQQRKLFNTIISDGNPVMAKAFKVEAATEQAIQVRITEVLNAQPVQGQPPPQMRAALTIADIQGYRPTDPIAIVTPVSLALTNVGQNPTRTATKLVLDEAKRELTAQFHMDAQALNDLKQDAPQMGRPGWRFYTNDRYSLPTVLQMEWAAKNFAEFVRHMDKSQPIYCTGMSLHMQKAMELVAELYNDPTIKFVAPVATAHDKSEFRNTFQKKYPQLINLLQAPAEQVKTATAQAEQAQVQRNLRI
jgi:hypothetical protein